MICQNQTCQKDARRLVSIRNPPIRVCDACYLHYRKYGQLRLVRKCNQCKRPLPGGSKKEYCSDCWASLPCVYEGCTGKRVRYSPSGLCSGHIAMYRRTGGSLSPLNENIVNRNGLGTCPIHKVPHRKTPKGHNRCLSCDRETRWRRDFGITPEQVYDMVSQQGGTCALEHCGRAIDLSRSGTYHIDHCHESNEVRGILCPQHNQMLGMAGDNIDILRDAIQYLGDYSGRI